MDLGFFVSDAAMKAPPKTGVHFTKIVHSRHSTDVQGSAASQGVSMPHLPPKLAVDVESDRKVELTDSVPLDTIRN